MDRGTGTPCAGKRLQFERKEDGYAVVEPCQKRLSRSSGGAGCQARKFSSSWAKLWTVSGGLTPNTGCVLTWFHTHGLALWNFL